MLKLFVKGNIYEKGSSIIGAFGYLIADEEGVSIDHSLGIIPEEELVSDSLPQYVGIIEGLTVCSDFEEDIRIEVIVDSKEVISQIYNKNVEKDASWKCCKDMIESIIEDKTVFFKSWFNHQYEHACIFLESLLNECYSKNLINETPSGWSIEKIAEATYKVKGKYIVDIGLQTCTCPDFKYRHRECKHILEVDRYLETEEKE